ncbi:MAG: hypothetical protein LKK18_01055 [Clostridiales bacterium]|nr:hypothetical protein [Clostridiales bacterium]
MNLGKDLCHHILIRICVMFAVVLCVIFATNCISPCFATTKQKQLAHKSSKLIVAVQSHGWVAIQTTLSGSLYYHDNSTHRTFTKEYTSLVSKSPNSREATAPLTIDLGYLRLSAGGKMHVCYSTQRYSTIRDPKWLASDGYVSNITAVGKLNGGSYCTLGYNIYGGAVIEGKTEKWTGIAH